MTTDAEGVLRLPSQPDGSPSKVLMVPQAVVVPPDQARFKQRAGVLDRNGSYVAQGATSRFESTITLEPKQPEAIRAQLEGRWLWAGVLFDHFGHYLVESMSRLWAFHTGLKFDGICYTPKRPRRKGPLLGFQDDVMQAFGITRPVHIIKEPTQIEHLTVPRQGFGLGDLVSGTPEMRDAVRIAFGRNIAAEGPDRLYVSRSKLGASDGGIMNETEVEANLAAEGYEIFHPQEHSIFEQIARYKAAKQIIISDGSAGHLFAYVGREHQRVAYLPRRSFWADGITDHIAAFSGRSPTVLTSLAQEWLPREKNNATRGHAFVLHDMAALQATLAENGFVAGAPVWSASDPDLIAKHLEARGLLDTFHDVSGLQ
ncbi:Capsular polysaccharide biosynthesis protein [Tritonibacter multivorans]|uniref:Capsular polysaccharide biosynthesis protein n=1 Tax=Tritonibacter multivorans TaxID=928856 RepID=A0A0P1GIY6_9RHOB|nr:glycosyltransferase 61 family protein [Tritonibacter multivorans]MDA7419679.1 glycosyltransferase 61 family protein [Tritonibacter multivorans]CUH75963.1 Capsular polysaccharide biosynthesis protein [Tritonibacter multivorans]SFC57969.1 Protein of unknown function [Tritonibacter multivorans]